MKKKYQKRYISPEEHMNTSNQPSKFRTETWVEINDESRGTYPVHRQINFKTSMLRSSL